MRKRQVQNKQAFKMGGWRVVDRKEEKNAQQLIKLVDELTWRSLEKLEFRHFLNFGRVYFRFLGKK